MREQSFPPKIAPESQPFQQPPALPHLSGSRDQADLLPGLTRDDEALTRDDAALTRDDATHAQNFPPTSSTTAELSCEFPFCCSGIEEST